MRWSSIVKPCLPTFTGHNPRAKPLGGGDKKHHMSEQSVCKVDRRLCEVRIGFTVAVDWLQSLKQFFINVSYHILVASLTLMALFLKQSHQS